MPAVPPEKRLRAYFQRSARARDRVLSAILVEVKHTPLPLIKLDWADLKKPEHPARKVLLALQGGALAIDDLRSVLRFRFDLTLRHDNQRDRLHELLKAMLHLQMVSCYMAEAEGSVNHKVQKWASRVSASRL